VAATAQHTTSSDAEGEPDRTGAERLRPREAVDRLLDEGGDGLPRDERWGAEIVRRAPEAPLRRLALEHAASAAGGAAPARAKGKELVADEILALALRLAPSGVDL
jgi:hypothetical protein